MEMEIMEAEDVHGHVHVHNNMSADAAASNGCADHEENEVNCLSFEDEDLVPNAMRALNMMRKNKHFCDVILHTGNAEVPAHRSVLAAASPYLFELFTTDQDRAGGSGNVSLPLSYKLSGPCELKALMSLVDYAYTGKLSVPASQVRAVYLCAWQLRMDSVVTKCGRFLAGALLARDTCLAVRALPGLAATAKSNIDKYIADNFSSLYQSSTLSSLPMVQLEVLYVCRKDMDLVEHHMLSELILHWLRDQISEDQIDVSSLCGRTHLLYISGGGGLKDCAALPPTQSDTPLVQDYRRMILKCPPAKCKRNGHGHHHNGDVPVNINGANGRRSSQLYSHDIVERAHHQPGEDWAVIVSERLAEHTFLSLCTLDSHLVLVSTALRLNESPLPSPGTQQTLIGSGPSICQTGTQPLANLERPRTAHGIAVLDGKLVVCGGYDRVECLNSVEMYDPDHNKWSTLPDMRQQRGRFNIAQIGNRIYAVGGSDGHVELDSMEMYQHPEEHEGDSGRSMTASLESQSGSIDLSHSKEEEPVIPTNGNGHNGSNGTTTNRKKAWQKKAKLPFARSYAGVCGGAEGRVYCVGGWAGQAGVRDCHVYDTREDTWNEIAPLNTGRYQAGVAIWNGSLWVVGGCDSWHCLQTTEVFSELPPDVSSPSNSSWRYGPSMSVARRGCGVAAWGSKLVCAGGSDGQHSLKSVEFLSSAPGASWELGPAMREPRAGLALAAINEKLYAIGGYSGKLFLSTMEYLVEGSDEWTSFTFPIAAQIASRESSRGPSPAKLIEDQKSLQAQLKKLNFNIHHHEDKNHINGNGAIQEEDDTEEDVDQIPTEAVA